MALRRLAAWITCFGLVALTWIAPPAQAASKPQQVITVRTASAQSTTAVIEAWKLGSDGNYRRVWGPVAGYVGTDGVGRASEYRAKTPRGVFTISEAFGRRANPGTQLPYSRVGSSDWWVSDVSSPLYNTLQTCRAGSCPFSTSASEQLGAISLYDYALVIDYNRSPVVAGAGSAFFMHISEGMPTQGCVSLPRKAIKQLLRWVKPARDPVISIGIGDKAYAPIR